MVSRRWTSSGRMRTTLIGVAWVALIGCGDTASRNNWTTVRDTLPSGAVRVTNILAAGVSPMWTVVEELRVDFRPPAKSPRTPGGVPQGRGY